MSIKTVISTLCALSCILACGTKSGEKENRPAKTAEAQQASTLNESSKAKSSSRDNVKADEVPSEVRDRGLLLWHVLTSHQPLSSEMLFFESVGKTMQSHERSVTVKFERELSFDDMLNRERDNPRTECVLISELLSPRITRQKKKRVRQGIGSLAVFRVGDDAPSFLGRSDSPSFLPKAAALAELALAHCGNTREDLQPEIEGAEK